MNGITAFFFLTFFFNNAIDAGEILEEDQVKKFVNTISESCEKELIALERAVQKLQLRDDVPEVSDLVRKANMSMAIFMLR